MFRFSRKCRTVCSAARRSCSRLIFRESCCQRKIASRIAYPIDVHARHHTTWGQSRTPCHTQCSQRRLIWIGTWKSIFEQWKSSDLMSISHRPLDDFSRSIARISWCKSILKIQALIRKKRQICKSPRGPSPTASNPHGCMCDGSLDIFLKILIHHWLNVVNFPKNWMSLSRFNFGKLPKCSKAPGVSNNVQRSLQAWLVIQSNFELAISLYIKSNQVTWYFGCIRNSRRPSFTEIPPKAPKHVRNNVPASSIACAVGCSLSWLCSRESQLMNLRRE